MLHIKKYGLAITLLIASFQAQAQINTDRMQDIGRNALYFEDYVLAIQYFNKIIRVKPYLSHPYYYRSVAKYSLEDFKGAEEDIRKALEINPFMVDAYNLSGIIRQNQKDPDGAIEAYSSGLSIEPENINLLINRGNSKMSLKDYEGAINDYNKVLKTDPNLVSACLNRGMAKVNAKDTIGALNDFSHVIKINPYLPDGFANRGILYYQTNEFEKALSDYDKVIELSPDEYGFYLNRGIIRYQLDDLQGTLVDLDKVIELNPQYALAYSNRGLLRMEIGDYNRAIEDFSRVLALDATDLITLYNRGLVYNEIGEYQLAINDFNIVADNYPDFPQVYQARGFAKYKLNNMAGYTKDYNTAMKLESDNQEKKKNEALVAKTKAQTEGGEETEEKKQPKATRKKSDKDIRNYNKIAVLDDFGAEEVEEQAPETIRGRVQNRNIIIDMEPVFGLSFYSADSLMVRSVYYESSVSVFNRKSLYDKKLRITNREAEAEGYSALNYFTKIRQVSELIEDKEPDYQQHFVRGVLYGLVMNYNNAIMDYDALLKHYPDDILTIFNRAYVRYKMVEVIRSMEKEAPPEQIKIGGPITAKNTPDPVQLDASRMERILDYDIIMDDLNKVIELDETFEFAWFNRGIIKAILKDYEGALADFSRALEINPEFAEAYYNRGLTRIYLDQNEAGTNDLSKAGELGIFKAYNVIKRYGVDARENN
jgi:tetratricopeptide (TPR) repeat protein